MLIKTPSAKHEVVADWLGLVEPASQRAARAAPPANFEVPPHEMVAVIYIGLTRNLRVCAYGTSQCFSEPVDLELKYDGVIPVHMQGAILVGACQNRTIKRAIDCGGVTQRLGSNPPYI